MFCLALEELIVVWAAMLTMVKDVHCLQDNLTEQQWQLAEDLYNRLDVVGNKHFAKITSE